MQSLSTTYCIKALTAHFFQTPRQRNERGSAMHHKGRRTCVGGTQAAPVPATATLRTPRRARLKRLVHW